MRKGKRHQKGAFIEAYMQKSRPKLPRCICSSKIKDMLGIASPSLYQLTACGYFGKKNEKQLREYEYNFARFQCYKRTLTKEGWKWLKRETKKRGKEGKASGT